MRSYGALFSCPSIYDVKLYGILGEANTEQKIGRTNRYE